MNEQQPFLADRKSIEKFFQSSPPGWHYFGSSTDIKNQIVKKTIDNIELIAWRNETGKIVISSSRCLHMNADLSKAKKVDGEIMCAYHGWTYNHKGACKQSQKNLKLFPVYEIDGHVFLFNKEMTLFDFPEYENRKFSELSSSRIFTFESNSNWYTIASHVFDIQHYESCHDRLLTGRPKIENPSKFARKISYSAKVVGNNWRERLIRFFAGNLVTMNITAHGSNLFLLNGYFTKNNKKTAETNFLVSVSSLPNNRSITTGIVFVNKSRFKLLDRFKLEIKRFFTHAYLFEENITLEGTHLNLDNLVQADEFMMEYFNWLLTLPHFDEQNVRFQN